MKAESITLDELHAALKDAGYSPDQMDDGLSMSELCLAWGVGDRIAKRHLHAAAGAGILKVGVRVGTNLIGRLRRTPVYSFTKKGKK